MSALPKFTMRQLLDAGVHFGHKTMRWNPRMQPYIFSARNDIHILDLQKTVPMLYRALEAARDVAANNGRILFVSTKRQASEIIADTAKRCGQYYVNHRWLGGMLTNWDTVSRSIKTLRTIEEQLADPELHLSKKERLKMQRDLNKLELSLGGIKDMGGLPNMIFVIDTNKENIAILEAQKLGIPVVAIADSNSNPDGITYLIPGNDDATRAIKLYCTLFADAVLSGIQAGLSKSSGKKEGEKAEAQKEKLPTKVERKAKKPVKKEEAKTEKPSKKPKEEEKAAAEPKKPAGKKKKAS